MGPRQYVKISQYDHALSNKSYEEFILFFSCMCCKCVADTFGTAHKGPCDALRLNEMYPGYLGSWVPAEAGIRTAKS